MVDSRPTLVSTYPGFLASTLLILQEFCPCFTISKLEYERYAHTRNLKKNHSSSCGNPSQSTSVKEVQSRRAQDVINVLIPHERLVLDLYTQSPLLARSSAAMSEYEVALRKAPITAKQWPCQRNAYDAMGVSADRGMYTILRPYISCRVTRSVVSRWPLAEVSDCDGPYLIPMWLLQY